MTAQDAKDKAEYIIIGMLIGVALSLAVVVFVGRPPMVATATPPAVVARWHTGLPPQSAPVIGVWLNGNQITTAAIIRTDTSGIRELSPANLQPVPVPDYWAPIPEVP